MLAFDSAVRALKFCAQAQSALLAANWDPLLLTQRSCELVTSSCFMFGTILIPIDNTVIFKGLRVRMGVNIGSPTAIADPISGRIDYLGPTVNKAARVATHAQGGQVIISSDVYKEVSSSPAMKPLGTLSELGVVTLRGIASPEVLYEVSFI